MIYDLIKTKLFSSSRMHVCDHLYLWQSTVCRDVTTWSCMCSVRLFHNLIRRQK